MYEQRTNDPLPRVKSSTTPHYFYFTDTETHRVKGEHNTLSFPYKLSTGVFLELDDNANIKRRQTDRHTNAEEQIQSILCRATTRGTLYCIGFNIGFDVRVLNLPRVLTEMGWTSEPPILNNRIFLWTIRKDRKCVTFLDLANFGVLSLAKLGEEIGLPKGVIDFDTCSVDKLMSYCENDTEILVRFTTQYIKFLRDNNLGSFKQTIASQALTTYRYRFMLKPIHIHNDERTLALERDGYHGARTECFFIGTKQDEMYHLLDVNSMYPYVMRNNTMPTKILRYQTEIPIKWLEARMQTKYNIARVVLSTDLPAYALYYRDKLVFPTGTFTTVLHQNELTYALEHGHITRVIECATYDKASIFDQYIDFFYQIKQEANDSNNTAWRLIAKLFMNALYGKFGQQLIDRDEISHCGEDLVFRLPVFNRKTGEFFTEFAWFGTIYRETRGGETSFSFPGIAGAITSSARMELWSLLRLAGRENVLYCDTDSLMVNQEGYSRLSARLDASQLGSLSTQATASEVIIRGAKDYQFGAIDRTKGIPDSATQMNEESWHYLQFQGMVRWLNEGASGPPWAQETQRTRRSVYDKGQVFEDGSVLPFAF